MSRRQELNYAESFWMIAFVYSVVEALPPRSPVMNLPSAMVCTNVRVLSRRITDETNVPSALPSRFCRHAHLGSCVYLKSSQGVSFCAELVNYPAYLNIMIEDSRRAVGLASPFPVIRSLEPSDDTRVRAPRTSNIWGRTMHSLEDGRVLGWYSSSA